MNKYRIINNMAAVSEYVDSTEAQGTRGGAVEALRYKAGDRGFDSRWCHWKFSLI